MMRRVSTSIYLDLSMPADYFPILVMVVVVIAFAAIALTLSAITGPRRPNPAKLAPYESGMPPFGSARRRFSIRYYLTAVLFILFDIEIIFFYPWAVLFRQLELFGLIEMGVFILVLVIGYIYVWRKGGFEWD
jgi:NADH-quinone oxidoreductase subunit A